MMRRLLTHRRAGWTVLLLLAAAWAVGAMAAVAVRTSGAAGLDTYEAVREATTSDFRDFWWTARHLRVTGELSTAFGVHNYPPFFPIFMLPWSYLPLPVAAVLFAALSIASFALAVVMAEHLLNDGFDPRPRCALLAAVVLVFAYVHACGVVGNVGLLLAALIVATWFLVERGREWEAGVALGFAALIKLLPALLIVFFLLKRRWRVAGAAIIVAAVFGAGLPLVTFGFKQTVAQHTAFFQRAVRDHSAASTIMCDQPPKAMYNNNGLPIVLRRLLSPVNAGKTEQSPIYVNFVNLPRWAILAVYAAIMATILGVSVATTLRGPPQWPPASADEGRTLRAQCGLWCCLMLLASPLVWTHYLPMVYWPLAFLADRADRIRRAQRSLCPVSVTPLSIWAIAVVLMLVSPAARAAGVQILGVLAVWSGLAILLLTTGRNGRKPA